MSLTCSHIVLVVPVVVVVGVVVGMVVAGAIVVIGVGVVTDIAGGVVVSIVVGVGAVTTDITSRIDIAFSFCSVAVHSVLKWLHHPPP